jgi:hypothetical protein
MNENPEISACLADLDHPLKDVIAEISGEHLILEGKGKPARDARFPDMLTVEGRRAALKAVVRAWCDERERA